MKKRVFAILAEPASYTVDRNINVYDKLGIKYCYMRSSSLAKSDQQQEIKPLESFSDAQLKSFLTSVLEENDIIILNGTRTRTGRMLIILNRKYHRSIGIDSDGQLYIPSNPIKRIAKYIFYHHLYAKRYIFGLAGGSYTHKDAFRYYGMPEDHIFLSPMMVNNNKFAYNQMLNNDKFTFLYVGRIVVVKNIELMINAFLLKFTNNDTVSLRIVGTGELLDVFKTKYSKHRNIVFAGPKYGDELVKEYHKANVFVLPSSYEPWGLVVNEAMCASLPAIVSDQVGAAWDLVKYKETGFIFKYDDCNELAQCMEKIYKDKSLYKKYSDNAYEIMMNYWNYDLYRKNLELFIESACK